MTDDNTNENDVENDEDTKKKESKEDEDPWADLDATLVSDDSFESSDESDDEALEIELARNRKRRENDPTMLIKKPGAVSVTSEHGGLDGAGYASYSHGGAFQVRLVSHLCFSDCAMELR